MPDMASTTTNHAPVTAYVAFGANLGDRGRQIYEAVSRLSTTPGVETTKISPLIETAPVGGPPDSPPFLNGVAEVTTTLSPTALLHALQSIEKTLGRGREQRWEPRVVDLDLILYGDRMVSTDELSVPHPMMHQRRFVLEPLAALAPDAVHPMLNMTVSGLLESLLSVPPASRD